MRKLLLIKLLLLIAFTSGISQKLTMEGSVNLGSKINKAYYTGYKFDAETQKHTLVYLEKGNLLAGSSYSDIVFDKDLKFVENKVEKVPTKSTEWVQTFFPNYQGDEYIVEGVELAQGLSGNISVNSRRITWKWTWGINLYMPHIENLGKAKLKEKTEKYWLFEQLSNYQTGEVLAICGVKDLTDKTKKKQYYKNFQFIKFDKNATIVKGDELKFETMRSIVFSRVIDSPDFASIPDNSGDPTGDLGRGDALIAFAPMTMPFSKQDDPNKGNYLFVVVSPEGKIKNKWNVNVPASAWNIEGIIRDGEDAILYGPATFDKYHNSVLGSTEDNGFGARKTADEIAWKAFQVMRINNGAVKWIKATDLDAFESKLKTPPSQKRKPEYKGKGFQIAGTKIVGNDIFITGQKVKSQHELDASGRITQTSYTYTDIILMHFSSDGDLKAQYGVRRDENNKFSKANLTPQELYASSDGKKLYWVVGELSGLKRGLSVGLGILGSSTIMKRKFLFYPNVATVDIGASKISDFTAYGQDEKGSQKYYTNDSFESKDGKYIIFPGEDKSGSTIWLGAMEK